MSDSQGETKRLVVVKNERTDCRYFWCEFLLTLFGITFLFTGIIMTCLWPRISEGLMKNKLRLEKNTETHENWQQITVPLYMNIYLFNWTNPEETIRNGTKPILQQLGPYVFKENHTKVDTTFNTNDTITYRQVKSWQFDRSRSNGSLADRVTTINIVLNILGEKLQAMDKRWAFILVNNYFKLANIIKPYVTKTAGEFIFDGYEDPILDIVARLQFIIPVDIRLKKVGWLYGMNMSTSADGLVNMFTGKDDIEKIGLVHSVNYNTKLNVFNKDCSYSNASLGDLWPEHTAVQPNMSLYIPSICSAITMKNKNHKYVNGIRGVKFSAESDVFNNTCYCLPTGCSSPAGVRSLRLCKDNSFPIFISFPHFYLADKSYRKPIIGMKPNRNLHEFSIILENDYSIPLHIAARLQFNVKLSPIKGLTILKNIPDLYLPILWFSENVEIPHDVSDKFLMVTDVMPTLMTYLWLILAFTGSIMLINSTYLWLTRKKKSLK